MRASRPVIALLTDFGLSDHYVAAMKGVMLGIVPDAVFLDITHDIAPQDVLGGALELEAVAPYLPYQTTVLGVVDPGVGTSRRAVAIDTGRLRFVGPDNGLFTLAMRAAATVAVSELTDAAYHRPVMSRTFEGRDRFAPVAAHVASGVSVDDLGPAITDLVTLRVPEPREDDTIEGEVLRVDRFGNLLTNISGAALARLGPRCTVQVAGQALAVATTYGDVPPDTLVALVGSTERLEIAVHGGSAAAVLGLARGAAVSVRPR